MHYEQIAKIELKLGTKAKLLIPFNTYYIEKFTLSDNMTKKLRKTKTEQKVCIVKLVYNGQKYDN